jgi:hypothetical protein
MIRVLSAWAAVVVMLLASKASAAPELRPMRDGTELFVDDVNVAKKVNVVRRVHAATKLDTPVMVSDKPWERGGGPRIYGAVHYDPKTSEFRMWYSKQYATSTDGIHWTKPALDVVVSKGLATNFVLPKSGGAVIVDEIESDASKRYKALLAEPREPGDEEVLRLHSPLRSEALPDQRQPETARSGRDERRLRALVGDEGGAHARRRRRCMGDEA